MSKGKALLALAVAGALAGCGQKVLLTWDSSAPHSDSTIPVTQTTTVKVVANVCKPSDGCTGCSDFVVLKSDAGQSDPIEVFPGAATEQTLVLTPGTWSIVYDPSADNHSPLPSCAGTINGGQAPAVTVTVTEK